VTWRAVAARDVRGARRSVGLWLVAGLQTLLFVGVAVWGGAVAGDPVPAQTDRLATVAGVVLPLVAVLVGYRSVVGDRTSGRLRLALSLPHSRLDLAVGTLVGRSVVFAVPTVVALVLAGSLAVGLADGPAAWGWLGPFVAATTLYGVAFVGLAVGVSLLSGTGRRATAGAVGGYLVTVVLWTDLHTAALLLLHRFDTAVTSEMPGWALLVRLAGPGESYDLLLRAGTAADRAGRYADAGLAGLAWPTAVALLAAWTLLPVALGYLRFRTAEL
jgi:ABC-2 type transport system permease protein